MSLDILERLTPAQLDTLIDSRDLYRLDVYRETGILFTSNSQLGGVVKCRRKALLQSLGFHGTGERLKMDAGVAAHAAIAIWRRNPTVEPALRLRMALTEFRRLYLPVVTAAFERMDAIQLKYTQAYAIENLEYILGLAFETFLPAQFFTVHPELVEIPAAVVLCDDPPIVACCRLDALVSDGDLWLVDDVKTTGKLDSSFARGFELDSQFSHYTYAAEQHVGDRQVLGGTVTAIQFNKPPEIEWTKAGAPKKCRTPGHGPVDECRPLHIKMETIGPTLRDEGMHTRWKQTAIANALRLKDVYDRYLATGGLTFEEIETDGSFSRECPFCEFHDFATAGYPPHGVATMLTRDKAVDVTMFRDHEEASDVSEG